MKKSDLQNLRSSITPGAVGTLYEILGEPHFYDTTWQGNNTIVLSPHPSSQLYKMRRGRDTVCYCRNITTRPIGGDAGFIEVKLECSLSSNQEI